LCSSIRDGVLVERELSCVNVFMDGETRFPIESFKLSMFGFHGAEISSEPGSRPSKENRARFDRSK